jgi:hypothetical protein
MNLSNQRGQALYNIFQSHIEQLNTNGLSIIDAATGYGKSFQARKYIIDNCKINKFIFLAPQKKLFLEFKKDDIEMMKQLLNEEPIIINLIPAFDTFREYFLKISDDNIFNQISNVSSLRRVVTSIQKANIDDIEFYREFFNKEEQIFRKELKELLKDQKEFKRDYKKDGINSYNKKDILSFFSKYEWIVKLYPGVLAPFANLIQMTIHKSYYPIDTLWYGQHEISNKFDNLFKNYIVFIDEFDSTKEALLSIIISNITNQDRVNLFKTITYIYNSLSNICSNNILPKKFFGDKQEQFENRIFQFYNDLKENYNSYHLESTLKYLNDGKSEQFLFRDKQIIDVYDSKNKGKLTIQFDENENCNIVKLEKEENNLFEEISDFISQKIDEFMILIADISKNFFEYKQKTRKKGDEVYSLYDSVCTIINEFNIGKSNEEYYSKIVYKYLTYTLKLANDDVGEFLDTGFKYFFLEDNSSHDLSTNVYYYHYNELPEHFLIGMAQNNIVIGISATATLNTYVKNYDMHYLSKKLGEHFIQINQDELNELKQDFLNFETRSHKVIDKYINDQQDLSLENFDYLFENLDEVLNNYKFDKYKMFDTAQITGDKKYRLTTYYNLFKTFITFINEKVHGMICFLNFKINDALELKFDYFKEQLEKTAKLKDYSCKIYTLDSNNFDEQYDKIKEELKKDNVFIISTYKTLALGKNLQYEFDGDEKDLDGVYLDKVTYVMPSVEKYNEDTLAEYLYALEYLKAEGLIKERKKFVKYISEGFKKYLTDKITLSVDKDVISAKDSIICKLVIQAIGRICRTKNKFDNVHIIMHHKIKEALIRKKKMLEDRMINYELQEILKSLPDEEKSVILNQKYIVENYNNNKNANYQITYLSYNWWTDLKRTEWINLRELVLKHPTTDYIDDINEIYYCQFGEDISSYVYQEKRLSENKLELFNISESAIADKYSNKVNLKSSRFKEMLKSKYVYDYCVKNGYATEFKKNKYILNPATFQRIYKGAIGEIAAKAILEAHGIIIKEIVDNKHFEKFDYYNGQVFYDMKNWSEDFYKNKLEMIDKIAKKAKKVGAKRVFIINVLKNNYQDIHENIIQDGIIYEISWLYDSKNDTYNTEAINLMKESQMYYGDIN